MRSIRLLISPHAIEDIQTGIDYYNSKQKGLGEKFYEATDSAMNAIRKNHYYQIRYSNVRCLPVKHFPFMIHYVFEQSMERVIIYAVLHTSLNPEVFWEAGN